MSLYVIFYLLASLAANFTKYFKSNQLLYLLSPISY